MIVGQGLAGSVLVRMLHRRNKSVVVFDENRAQTSSKIAAGLVNPITGRRFVLSWKFEEFNNITKPFYLDWQSDGCPDLVRPTPIKRAMEDRRFIDDVEAKTSDPYYKEYIQSTTLSQDTYIKPTEINYQISQAYRVNIQSLLENTRDELRSTDSLITQSFEYEALDVQDHGVKYKSWQANHIIFCEGAQGQHNPWFGHLPFQPTKGELFLLKNPKTLDFAYKRDLILLPMKDDLLWCGALNFWEFEDDLPSNEGEMILLQKLKKIYHPDPYIENHLAAIRPTVRDRRPLIGYHPQYPRLIIFNGLGTKGTLLAPFFGKQLLASMYENAEILPEANIKRFANKANSKMKN